jgi:hypothetical protein
LQWLVLASGSVQWESNMMLLVLKGLFVSIVCAFMGVRKLLLHLSSMVESGALSSLEDFCICYCKNACFFVKENVLPGNSLRFCPRWPLFGRANGE